MKSKLKNKKVVADEKDRLLSGSSRFAAVESYNTFRTNLMFSLPKSDAAKKIVLTSAASGEGKTTTSINLAVSFSQIGAKVLLVDCDLRKPRVHRYLSLERSVGVSNVLCGFTGVDKAIKRNVYQGVDVITSGEATTNPTELLMSQEFKNMLGELEGQYDYIIIDTPPVSIMTDAVLVSERATGVVVVVRDGVTNTDVLDTAVENLKKSDIKILGFVMLHDMEREGKSGYGSYKYGYEYGYGEKEDDKS